MILSDAYLWLSYSHVRTDKINRLLDRMPIERLWGSFDAEGRYALDEPTFAKLKRTRNADFLERAKSYLRLNGIEYVTRADPAYPERLDQREVNPPPVLYYKGDIGLARTDCIAVVGTRQATPYGRYATDRIVTELAKGGLTVVSGMATGIDGFAHEAALKAGGKTIAVLGSGLFNPTPASHLRLFDEISKNGLVISEYTPDVHATVYTFPERNRIISGLSRGVLVVEAKAKSGSLITVKCALEQGRDVFAVPGDIDSPRSVGTNSLLRQGAAAAVDADDIFDFYGIKRKKITENAPIELDFNETAVLNIIEAGESSFDEVATASGLAMPDLCAAVSSLVIKGLIREKAKNVYCSVRPASGAERKENEQ